MATPMDALKLSRPEPAMPSSYFWTWDHSCNWMLDDPGLWNDDCANTYLKRPETFLEDYRRLTDFAAGLGVEGITVYGFLRDSHGGIEYAKRVAAYAASRGVALMPGVGLTWYGGPYYEGEHKHNISTFLRRNPQAKAVATVNPGGEALPGNVGACPTHPDFVSWMAEGLNWLFKEFEIGGVNLENGDFMVCQCDRCKAHKASWPSDDVDTFRMQALVYLPAIEALRPHLKDKLIVWATYTGWAFEQPNQYPDPAFDGMVPTREPRTTGMAHPDSIAQWNIKAMLRKDAEALPLAAYLDDGAPTAALGSLYWPAGLRPVPRRNVAFIHQGSQWWLRGTTDRYSQVISTFKEGCLRSYRSGVEGISVHGEVTPYCTPWLLNYLAFSHFIHWPEDSLRDFGRKTLGQVLGSEREGEQFVELMCAWDSHALTDSQKADIRKKSQGLRVEVGGNGRMDKLWHAYLWHWLDRMARGCIEMHQASFY